MKHICRFLALPILLVSGISSLHAQWEQIGWEGGLIKPEAQLGNTLYGTALYSVYKSTDWGKTWSMFRKGLPLNINFYPSFYSLAVSGDKLYFLYPVGTAQPGLFFCREKDEEWTFKPLSKIKEITPSSNPNATMLISDDTVFALLSVPNAEVDTTQGFYLSTNGGNSWVRKMKGLPTSPIFSLNTAKEGKFIFAEVFFYDTVQNGYTYATFRTKDLGSQWEKLSMPFGDTIEYHFYPIGDSILLIQSGFDNSNNPHFAFYRSSDFGTSWINVGDDSLPAKDTPYNIDFVTSAGNKIFISLYEESLLTDHIIFGSEDGGIHWKTLRTDATIYEGIFGRSGQYILSTDKGMLAGDSALRNLIPIQSRGAFFNERTLVGVSGTSLFALPDASPDKTIFYDSLLVSTDNGSTWKQRPFSPGNRLDHNRWVRDGSSIYASGINIQSVPCIFRSTDNGNNWTIYGKLSTQDAISQFFVQGDTIVVILATNIWVTIDQGRSWIVQAKNSAQPWTQSACRNGYIIIPTVSGYQGYINYSDNFGKDWGKENTGSPFVDAAFGTYIFGNRWFVALSNSSGFLLYYQNKLDSAWKESKGLPRDLLSIPSCDEKNILYATGSGANGNASIEGRTALYYSLDSGANWKQLGDYVTNSPDVFIGSDYIFLSGPTELWRGPKPDLSKAVPVATIDPSVSIHDCYPNPAVAQMHIGYSVAKPEHITLTVFDITGKEIGEIVNQEHDAGFYEAVWNTTALPGGSYLLKLSAENECDTRIVKVVR